jgi:hypothetical protein
MARTVGGEFFCTAFSINVLSNLGMGLKPSCQDLRQKTRIKAKSADRKSNKVRTIMAQVLGITGLSAGVE